MDQASMPTLSAAEEQERWLHEAFKAVKQHSFYMKRALDESNLREALKHSAAMLGELRTSLLSPQKYYALYMKTFDELRHLESFFVEENKRGRSNAELYELVQHAGNILPRMCAVRASLVRSSPPPQVPAHHGGQRVHQV